MPRDALGKHVGSFLGTLGTISVVWECPGDGLAFGCILGPPPGGARAESIVPVGGDGAVRILWRLPPGGARLRSAARSVRQPGGQRAPGRVQPQIYNS